MQVYKSEFHNLITVSVVEIIIKGQRVYSGSEIDLGINKSIIELFEPDKRASDYTKTVEIAGTKEADSLFAALFDVNYSVTSATFDPSKRASAEIYADTIPQLVGYCQLTDIVILNENNHKYLLTFYGLAKSVFADMGDKKLSQLDMSEFDHEFTYANVENSWETSTIISGVPTAYQDGVGYWYPMCYVGNDPLSSFVDVFGLDDFKPFVFVKSIVDRIFKEIGIEYESTIFNSALFKKLIYNGSLSLLRTENEINNHRFLGERVAAQNTTLGNNWTTIIVDDVADPASQYNDATHVFTPAKNSTYKVNIAMGYQFENIAVAGAAQAGGLNIVARVNGVIVGNFEILPINGANQINGIPSEQIAASSVGVQYYGAVELILPRLKTTDTVQFQAQPRTQFPIGGSWTSGANTFNQANLRCIMTDKSLNIAMVAEIGEGDDIVISSILGNQTQKDFMMGLVKSFNLYFEPLPSGKLLIETYDDYFTSELLDLTPFLDTSQDFTIKPLEQSKYKRYKYSHIKGDDFFNTEYDKAHGEIYGSITIEVDNEFAKGQKDVSSNFSLPIMSSYNVANINLNERVVPTFLTPNGQKMASTAQRGAISLNSGKADRAKSVPYIMYKDGLLNCGTWQFDKDLFTATVKSTYPHAGQFDSLRDPNHDLCYFEPETVYFNDQPTALVAGSNPLQVNYPENIGLFNQYHYSDLASLINKDSKIVECYIVCDPYLYSQMSFRKLYFLNNSYYRLHNIENYDPTEINTCKITLLKLTDVNPFAKVARNTWGVTIKVGDPVGDVDVITDPEDEIGDDNVDIGFNNTIIALTGQEISGSGINLQGFNYIDIEDADYTYLGNEGSPFYIIGEPTALRTVTLPAFADSIGKVVVVVNMSLTDDIFVTLLPSVGIFIIPNKTATFLATDTAWIVISITDN